MINKQANSTAKSLVTPQGTTMWASLLSGNVFGGEPTAANPGHLEVLLVLDPKDAEVQAFYNTLNAECRRLVSEFAGADFDTLVSEGKVAEVPYNLKPDVDENKQPTGLDRLKFRRVAGGTRRDGTPYKNSVQFCDSQKQPIVLEEELGNGSIIRAIITPYAYYNMKYGVSLQIKTVQVIEARKRPSKSGDAFDMFDTVEPKPMNAAGDSADF